MAESSDAAPPMSITVRMLSGSETVVEAQPETSVSGLKQLLQDSLGIFACQQKLLLNGVELPDTGTLAELDVHCGSVLMCLKVNLPTVGHIEGRWYNNVGQTDQFSVGWDLGAPDKYGLRINNCGGGVTCQDGHTFREMAGMGMNFAFHDVLAFVSIFVSGAGSPVFRGSFGSSRDTGAYHGGFEESTDDLLAAAAGVCPRQGSVVGEWRDNRGAKGKLSVQWEDDLAKLCDGATTLLKMRRDDVDIPLDRARFEIKPTGLKVQFDFDGRRAVLEIFALSGDKPVFVGGFAGRPYGTFHGGFEVLET